MKKLFNILALSAIVSVSFVACENHMDIRDIEPGTPTNADSVLAPKKHHNFSPEELKKYNESLPSVYQR